MPISSIAIRIFFKPQRAQTFPTFLRGDRISEEHTMIHYEFDAMQLENIST